MSLPQHHDGPSFILSFIYFLFSFYLLFSSVLCLFSFSSFFSFSLPLFLTRLYHFLPCLSFHLFSLFSPSSFLSVSSPLDAPSSIYHSLSFTYPSPLPAILVFDLPFLLLSFGSILFSSTLTFFIHHFSSWWSTFCLLPASLSCFRLLLRFVFSFLYSLLSSFHSSSSSFFCFSTTFCSFFVFHPTSSSPAPLSLLSSSSFFSSLFSLFSPRSSFYLAFIILYFLLSSFFSIGYFNIWPPPLKVLLSLFKIRQR